MDDSPVNIVVDCRWILRESSGIGVYTRNLVRALLASSRTDRYRLLFHDAELARRETTCMSPDTGAAESWVVPWGPYSLLGQLRLPARLHAAGQVYHSPNYLIPYAAFPRRGRRPMACVATIHDLIPLKFPDHAPRARKSRFLWLYRRLVQETVRRADAVIVPSRATRDDVLRILAVPGAAEKITVIPEAPPPGFAPAPAQRSTTPLVLYVGRRDPYKNLPLLVEAFARVRRHVPEARLEVVGPRDPRYPEPEIRARELGVADAIAWLGHLPDSGLLAAYRRAHVFVLPSRYEGFGLPVLEAMACGCPVVCSRAGALPEAAGEAALYVDPLTAENLAAAICRILQQPELAARLVEAGRKQAARFSWDRTARQTREVYQRLIRNAPPQAEK